METAKVYRYESIKDGRGPYNSDMSLIDSKYAYVKDHMNENHTVDIRPSLFDDGLWNVLNSNVHMCACHSLEALIFWFNGYNADLLKFGFVIFEYVVEEVFLSKSNLQCIFDKTKVIEKNRISLSL